MIIFITLCPSLMEMSECSRDADRLSGMLSSSPEIKFKESIRLTTLATCTLILLSLLGSLASHCVSLEAVKFSNIAKVLPPKLSIMFGITSTPLVIEHKGHLWIPWKLLRTLEISSTVIFSAVFRVSWIMVLVFTESWTSRFSACPKQCLCRACGYNCYWEVATPDLFSNSWPRQSHICNDDLRRTHLLYVLLWVRPYHKPHEVFMGV